MVHLTIPNYNGSKYLRNLLTSAIAYHFGKIIICDDCSTDDSKKNYQGLSSHMAK